MVPLSLCLTLSASDPTPKKIVPGIRDQLGFAWMIDRFHAGDDLHQLGIVLVDVFCQLSLCIGRSRNENRAGVRHLLRDAVQKIVVSLGVPAADGTSLVMDILGRMIRMRHEFLDVGRVEMKHTRFAMIDPNDGVIVEFAHKIEHFLAINGNQLKCLLDQVPLSIFDLAHEPRSAS